MNVRRSLEHTSERATTAGVLLVGITGILLTSLPVVTRWGLRAAARRA
jgi:hypothetical protein